MHHRSPAVTLVFLLFFFYRTFRDEIFPSPITATSQVPIDSPTPFPTKIWQTWKKPASDLDRMSTRYVNKWITKNPSYQYELLTDEAALSYVQRRLADHPRIAETYTNITDPILRSDLFRYILLYLEGGVYTDIDTHPLRPIDSWISVENASAANVVIGIEADHLKPEWPEGLRFHFCQWTVMARPAHPLLWGAIEYVVDALHDKARAQGTDIANLTLSTDEVGQTTGPVAWTNAVMAYMTSQRGFENVTRWDAHNMTEPKLVGDVMVLPVTSFANGQLHSNSGSPMHPDALVMHHFKHSWVDEHGGFS